MAASQLDLFLHPQIAASLATMLKLLGLMYVNHPVSLSSRFTPSFTCQLIIPSLFHSRLKLTFSALTVAPVALSYLTFFNLPCPATTATA